MKKIFVNTLCYAALLVGSAGCNHSNNSMHMMGGTSIKDHSTANGPFSAFLDTSQTNEKERETSELRDMIAGSDIDKFFDQLQYYLDNAVRAKADHDSFWEEIKGYIDIIFDCQLVNSALVTLQKEGAPMLKLHKEVEISQLERASVPAPSMLDMPEFYYGLQIVVASCMGQKEQRIVEIVDRRFEENTDLEMLETSTENVTERIKSLQEDVKAYASIKEWAILENVVNAIGSVVESIMDMLNDTTKDILAWSPPSLPEEVKVLLEEIPQWGTLPNRVKVVLTAEVLIKKMIQLAKTIHFGKSFISYKQELSETYTKKVENIEAYTLALFTSVKKLTLSMDKKYPDLASLLQKNRTALDLIIEEQENQLLNECFKQDRAVLLKAIQDRKEWLIQLRKLFTSKVPSNG